MIEQKYANAVLDIALKFDAISHSHGKISEIAISVTSNRDEVAARQLLIQIRAATQDSSRLEILQTADTLKDNLFRYFGYLKIANTCISSHSEYDDRSLTELIDVTCSPPAIPR